VSDQLVLEAGDARLVLDPEQGGRVASLVIAGDEILAHSGDDPVAWGSFPMVPYAGRVRRGRFSFRGREVALPLRLPPHAAHGTVLDRPWDVVDPRTLAIDLGPDWPFRGRVTQRFDLGADQLDVALELEADEPMPAVVGWHPWFRRRLSGSTARPAPPSPPAELRFDAPRMLARDAEGIPSGALVAPTPGPWDDCFTGLRSAPRLHWPERLALEISSSCDFWVVYDEPPDTICLEPQSGPPDVLNHDPPIVEPGRPLRATMRWSWTRG
jgi:aldose 1-epimerase